jgi:ParB-like chromosome segregation protein Spo0J
VSDEANRTGPRLIPLASIRRDEALICRANGIRIRTVSDYAVAMQGGASFPPIVVFLDREGTFWLADGFHRTAGAERAGLTEIAADVRAGGRHDALLYAASANAMHGVRRTSKDKRRAVELVLQEFPHATDRWVAERCGVDHKTVGAVRRTRRLGEFPQTTLESASIDAEAAASFDTDRELERVARALGAVERWPTPAFVRLRRLISRWWRPRLRGSQPRSFGQ